MSGNAEKKTSRKPRTSGFGQAVLANFREWEQGAPLTVRHVAAIQEPVNWHARDIKRLRTETLAVSQTVFARLIGVSLKLVEAWEAGTNVPAGPVRRLFEVIQRNPQEFLRRYLKGAA